MDKKSIEFHIKSRDYFGTLATVLNLIKQNIKNNKQCIEILGNLIEDLLTLQKEFIIIKK